MRPILALPLALIGAACAGAPGERAGARRVDVTFAHLGAVQVEPRPAGAPAGVPRAEASFRWLARALSEPQPLGGGAPGPPPELALLTGDLTEAGLFGDTASLARALLERLPVPWFLTPGVRDTAWGTVAPLMRERFGAWNYSFDQGGLHFVALDAAVIHAPVPSFDVTTLGWLRRDLAALPAGTPVVVFSHAAPDSPELAQPAELARLLAVLDGSDVVLFLHGGAGPPRARRVGGIDALRAAPAVALSPSDAPGYTLVDVRGGMLRAVHRPADGTRPPELLLEKPLAPPAAAEPFLLRRPAVGETARGEIALELEAPEWIEPRAELDGAPATVRWRREGGRWLGRLALGDAEPGAHILHLSAVDRAGRERHAARTFFVQHPEVEVLWRHYLGAAMLAGPLVDGELVVAATRLGRVLGLERSSGSEAWQMQFGSEVASTPCVSRGTFVMGTGRGGVIQLGRDGRTGWQGSAGAPAYGEPLAWEGRVFIGDDGGALHAFDGDGGRKLWTFQSGGPALHARPAALGSLLVFGAWDGHVYALDPGSGALRWREPGASARRGGDPRETAPAGCAPAIVGGRAWVCDAGGRIAVFDATGARQDLELEGAVAVGASPDGDYANVRGSGGVLTRLDSSGRVVWRAELELGRFPVPPIERDGRIAVISDRGLVSLVAAADGRTLWSYRATPGSFVLGPPAIDEQGVVYAAGLDGSLCALRGRR